MTALPTSAKCDRCKVRRVLLLAYVASVGKVLALCSTCNADQGDT